MDKHKYKAGNTDLKTKISISQIYERIVKAKINQINFCYFTKSLWRGLFVKIEGNELTYKGDYI